MSLLDQASLVVTPNGYKEDILYSVIPNTPLGDMDVVRATTATRVNSAGLIEVVPRNLVTYSEQFNDSSWEKQEMNITPNAIVSPNGTMTADFVIPTTVTSTHQISKNIGISQQSTMSVFAKANGYDTIYILDFINGFHGASFNLTTQVVTNSGSGIGSIINAGNGWYRCIVTVNTSGIRFYIPSPAGDFTGNGTSGVYLWGAQLEAGTSATEYFPTTTRLNIPRIDYTNGSCPSLLVEPQRTNLITYSEQFDDISWLKFNSTINANSIISPDGTQNADTLNGITGAGSGVYQTFTPTSGFYTLSVFAKKGTKNWISFVDVAGLDFRAWFNLDNGTLGTIVNGTAKIEDFGNGWYRCTYTSSTALTGLICQIGIAESNNTATLTSNGNIYIYGAQTEIGSYSTSYIPTVAATVTRNADVISKTGISSLIGQTEGTIFFDFYNTNSNPNFDFQITLRKDAGGTDYINSFIYLNDFYVDIKSNSISQFFATAGLVSINTRYKVCIAYKLNYLRIYINGVLKISQNTLIVPAALNGLILSEGNKQETINSVQLYKTQLTDAECIQLTTL
jgi:hypothetical protein